MTEARVLIVEDDMIIAMDVEGALIAAGYQVCGIARSEAEALAMAEKFRPELALVDINLSPGDGREVAKTLCGKYKTSVLFATGQCQEVDEMRGTGALACLPKPYASEAVPAALAAVRRMGRGERTTKLPKPLINLAA